METTLSLLGFTKDIIGWIIKFVQPKINVRPKKIHLNKTEWQKEGYFIVCNKTEEPLFDIQVLLWFSKNSGSKLQLKITGIDEQNADKDLEIQNIAVNPGVFIVKGTANNKEVMLIQIQYLSPKACKRVFYTLEKEIEGDVILQAVSTSKNPSPTVKKDNNVAIPFTPPKTILVSSISFLMKKF